MPQATGQCNNSLIYTSCNKNKVVKISNEHATFENDHYNYDQGIWANKAPSLTV